MLGGAMVPMNGYAYDHRLTGPFPPPPPMMMDRPMICDGSFDDGFMYDVDFDRSRRRRKHRSSHHYKYKHTSKPATNCVVM